MTFFFDHCVAPRIAKALCLFDKDIRILQEVFRPDIPDTEWMPAVEKQGWIVVTEDSRIRRRQLERAMLKGSTLRMIFLPEPFTREVLWEKFVKIVQWWSEIEEACEGLAPGTRLIMKTKKGKLHISVLESL